MLKRSLIILLCLVVSFALLVSGCSSNGDSGTTTATTTTRAATTTAAATTTTAAPTTTVEEVGYTLPLSTNGAVITITSYESLGPESFSTILPRWQKVTEETGVTIEWETIARADYGTAMMTRLAAGSTLSDIITVPGLNSQAGRYVQEGLFLALDELVAKYAPNITRAMQQRFDVYNQIRYQDGLMYGLPADIYGTEAYRSANDFYNPQTYIIRLDLLEQIGKDYPTTIDELYEVLQEFKKIDGIVPVGHAGFAGGLSMFRNSFGIPAAENFYPDDNDVVKYQLIRPEMKLYLAEMNKWYNEGLLDTEGDASTLNANIVNGTFALAPSNVGSSFILGRQLVANVPEGKMSILGPIAGPDGHALVTGYGFWSSIIIAITKDAKDPELAIKWLDYACFTDDAIYSNAYGVKDLDWEYDASGDPALTELGKENAANIPNYLYLQGAFTAGALPGVMLKQVREDLYWGLLSTLEWGQHIIDTAYAMGEVVTTPFPSMMAIGNELEIETQYMTDINTFVFEAVTNFITGVKPLDEFDSFVEAVKNMGIGEVEKVKQAQYDRYMSAQ